ncbi:GDSL-like lipase/acylhydrolase family protein [Kribbella voronezhensis]|uniref:GDSL-like lipase/acylhydrolase family protein n=1 Tax=Kribbella voronezhensis TaxID=2512212 RepID=A0A4V3FJM2_9ACTN|nr:SGNH/GDSL hydrolase family protein [Kribbella voronezhensis]TDU86903.1 GDSL-like lipase/acylhydrolase family protein [Kribbella voronezhensis]
MKIHRLIAACTAAALLGTLSITAPATAFAPAAQYKKYVALGDSYTSAPLVPLPELLSLGCLRSIGNYPKQLAARLQVTSFTDVSCGGADTTNMTQPQSTPLGTFPPQFNALTADTDLVTVGIGGNDFGVFGDITSTCPGLRASDPAGAPCKAHFTVDGKDALAGKIAQTQVRITEVVNGIKQRSPKATIVLVGYPKIAPEKGTCPDILPFADGDYAYLYSIEQKLNQAVENAAAAGGATYVDTFGPSTGHDACAPEGQAWIQGKDINLLRALNYHPRFEGQAGVASLTFKKLTGAQETVTAAEQARWAAEARTLSAKAAKDPAVKAAMNRLRTGAQR